MRAPSSCEETRVTPCCSRARKLRAYSGNRRTTTSGGVSTRSIYVSETAARRPGQGSQRHPQTHCHVASFGLIQLHDVPVCLHPKVELVFVKHPDSRRTDEE